MKLFILVRDYQIKRFEKLINDIKTGLSKLFYIH